MNDEIVLCSIPRTDLTALIGAEVRLALANWEPPKPKPDPLRMLTRIEVLSMLRVTSPTLRNLERSGRLSPCQRIGRKPLWRSTDVEAYLSGGK